jgi:hypothetical protein
VHSVCVRGGLGYGGGGASCKRIHIVFFFVKSTASLPVGVYLDPGSKNEQIKNDEVLHSIYSSHPDDFLIVKISLDNVAHYQKKIVNVSPDDKTILNNFLKKKILKASKKT